MKIYINNITKHKDVYDKIKKIINKNKSLSGIGITKIVAKAKDITAPCLYNDYVFSGKVNELITKVEGFYSFLKRIIENIENISKVGNEIEKCKNLIKTMSENPSLSNDISSLEKNLEILEKELSSLEEKYKDYILHFNLFNFKNNDDIYEYVLKQPNPYLAVCYNN